MPTPDASQYTQFRRYTSVSADAVGSVGSKISPFNTSYSIPMLSASSQALFLPSANKEKKFPPTLPPQTVILDLDGKVFASAQEGDFIQETYTFPSTNILNITFINAPPSISELGVGSELVFETGFGILTSSDTVTITNPTQTLAMEYFNGLRNVYVSQLAAFSFSLTTSSAITLRTVNPITSIEFTVV